MKKKGTSRTGNWVHHKKGGELLYTSVVTYDLDFKGQPCCLSMVSNITDRVMNEEKIREQNSFIQEIAWSQSHEIRRDLCSVISLIDLLKNADNEDERSECIKLLEQCSIGLDETIKSTNKRVDTLQRIN
jgi:hypothetical protein